MAELLKLYEENPSPKKIQKIAEVLRKGGLVIYPTDTVYGLGCDITNNEALKKIAQLKGIKVEKAKLSFVCEDLSDLSEYAKVNNNAFKILKRSLPGPYTFILKGSSNLPTIFKKKKNVGIRVPDNSIARSIVEELGNPIVSTSIKDEDEVVEYTTDPSLIYEKWAKHVDIVIDADYGGNIASTVVDLTSDEPALIREGKGDLAIF